MQNFNALKLFYEQQGDCNVATSHDVPKSLVMRVQSQHRALHCISLLNDIQLLRQNRLQSIILCGAFITNNINC